jgi:hypothetical protein
MKRNIFYSSSIILIFILGIFSSSEIIAQANCDLVPGWTSTMTLSGLVSTSTTHTSENILVPSGGVTIAAAVDIITSEMNMLGPITVASGGILTINATHISTNSGVMWFGISVEPGGELIIENESLVCYAINAVTATATTTGSGAFSVTNSELQQNQIGIAIGGIQAGAPYPGELHSSVIRGGNLLPAGTLFAKSRIGISVQSVSTFGSPYYLGLLVGDETEGQNLIIGLDRGIDASRSTLFVVNTKFEDIQNKNGPGNGYAIHTTSSGVDADLLVGTDPAKACDFKKCRYGITSSGMRENRVKNNTMYLGTGPFLRGIQFTGTTSVNIASENDIRDFQQFGILYEDNNSALNSINSNFIKSAYAAYPYDNTAIMVDQATAGTGFNLSVNENIIADIQRGIFIRNVPLTQMRTNEVNFALPAASTSPAGGIILHNCDGSLVQENLVMGNCPSGCSYTPTNALIWGIETENSSGVIIKANSIKDAGYGVLIKDPSPAGNSLCNRVDNCGVGFGFQDLGSGTIYGPVEGDWGTGEPSDNAWYPTGASTLRTICFGGGIATIGPDIDWYYRTSTSPGYGPQFNMPAGTNVKSGLISTPIIPTLANSTFDPCDGAAPMLRTDDSKIHPSQLSDFLENAEGADLSMSLYCYLKQQTIEGETDTDVSNALLHTQIPTLQNVENSIATGSFELASLHLSSLAPKTLWENSHKAILELINKKHQHAREEQEFYSPDMLTDTERVWCESIAALSSATNGEAVILAKALLNDNSLQIPPFEAVEREIDPNLLVNFPIVIQPNPVTDFTTVYWQKNKNVRIVAILSIDGQLIQQESVSINSTQLSINLQELTTGMYIVELKDNNRNHLTSVKFVKQ